MTNEEAIEYNKNLRMYMRLSDKNQPCKFLEENYIALDLAIKALEQQPSEDCISRAEAIKEINKCHITSDVTNQGTWNECVDSIIRTVADMPPVTPRTNLAETSQDLISREEAINYLMINMGWHDEDGYPVDDWEEKKSCISDLINGVPPVTPQRPKGKWIGSNGVNYTYPNSYTICSECKCHSDKFYKYCPNCGSHNGGNEDAT